MAVYLLPTALRTRDFGRWLAVALLCAAAGFLPYLDIPLRMWLGSIWTYSPENTWKEFWHVFFAQEEAQRQLRLVQSPASFLTAARDVVETLTADLTLPGTLLTAAAALFTLWRRHEWFAWCVLGAVVSYVVFPMFMPRLRLTQQSLMFAYLLLAVLLAYGAGALRPQWRTGVAALCLGWALWLGVQNWPFITTLTRDQSGVRYATEAEHLDAPLRIASAGPNMAKLASEPFAQAGDRTGHALGDHIALVDWEVHTLPTQALHVTLY